MTPTRSIILLAIALGLPGPGVAQSDPGVIPRRPKLLATADSNSATDYYWYGMSWLVREPETAAAAFYWASRLEPGWADAHYGRFVALLLAQPQNLINAYMVGRREGGRYERLVSIDSLASEALLRDPWVNRRIFGAVFNAWIGNDGSVGSGVPRYLRDQYPHLGAWMSYLEGKFEQSAAEYAFAIAKDPDDHMTRFLRAQPFLALGQNDSALGEVRASLNTIHRTTVDSLNFGYVSYPFLEYSLGNLFVRQNQLDSARAAYERALLNDLGFGPAHHMLGALRLARGDTTGALAEFNQAVTLMPEDAVLLYDAAVISLAAGQASAGGELLQRAVAAEPFYLKPHLALARLYDVSGFKDEAIAEYRTILGLAPRSMTAELGAVRERLVALDVPAQ